MKRSKCCNADVHKQNGSIFCTHCISIIGKDDVKNNRKYIWIALVIFILLFLCSRATAPTSINKIYNKVSSELIDNKTYAIDHFVIGLIESNNKSTAVSVKGAYGNMQIMPVTLDDWNKVHPTEKYNSYQSVNKKINTKIGKWMLEERIPQILKSKNIPVTINHILIGYNWGTAGVVDWYNAGAKYKDLPEETQQYICKYWAKF